LKNGVSESASRQCPEIQQEKLAEEKQMKSGTDFLKGPIIDLLRQQFLILVFAMQYIFQLFLIRRQKFHLNQPRV